MTRFTALGAALLAFFSSGCQAGVVAGGLVAHNEMEEEGRLRQGVYKAWLHNDGELERIEPEIVVAPTCPAPVTASTNLNAAPAEKPATPAPRCGLVVDLPEWQHCAARMKECTTETCTSGYVKAFNMVLVSRYFAADAAEIEASCKREPGACTDPRVVELRFLDSHDRRVRDLLAAKKSENKSTFEANDPAKMATFSSALAKELETWRAASDTKAVCQ
jgi:hypothetical protein